MTAASSPFPALSGLWAAAPTPFAAGGALDADALARHAARWVPGLGLAGLVFGGDSGERASLDHGERKRLFAQAAGAMSGRGGAGRGGVLLDCTDPHEGRMSDLIATASALAAPRLAVRWLKPPA